MSCLREAVSTLSWLSSAILESCLRALTLSTLSALPVPMLTQVYLQASWGLKNGDFARDILPKREDEASWADLGDTLGPSWGHRGPSVPSYGHLGPSWGHLGEILGYLGPLLGSSCAILGVSWAVLGVQN